jgi:nucleoside-diphosphate-sugar epimerase
VFARTPSFTILGAHGFIGAALVAWLESEDHIVHAITRASLPALLAARRSCGHVIDCIGATNDFRSRPHDFAEAHVGIVSRGLSELLFDSFLLLSSTQVYSRATATRESTVLPVSLEDSTDIYNATKLAGEALCLANAERDIRVARLSNVYGLSPVDTFIGRLMREGHSTGGVVFYQSPASTMDYVSIAAVVRLLPAIATAGRHRIYNLAAGSNTSHGAIASRLREIMGWRASFQTDAPTVRHLPIDTTRVDDEFGPTSSNLSADLPSLLALEQECQCSPSMRHMAA